MLHISDNRLQHRTKVEVVSWRSVIWSVNVMEKVE